MVTNASEIQKILLNIKFEENNQLHKDIELDYTPKEDEDWCLTIEDLYQEDNDSWNSIDVGDKHYNIQIFGDNDTERGHLYYQMEEVVMNEETNEWEHIGDWLNSSDGIIITNVRLITNDGVKRVRLK